MSPGDPRAQVLHLLDGFIDTAIAGLLANAHALEGRPGDRAAGQRIASYLVELDRLVSVRNGLGR